MFNQELCNIYFPNAINMLRVLAEDFEKAGIESWAWGIGGDIEDCPYPSFVFADPKSDSEEDIVHVAFKKGIRELIKGVDINILEKFDDCSFIYRREFFDKYLRGEREGRCIPLWV